MIYKVYEQHAEGFLPILQKFEEINEEAELGYFAKFYGAKRLFSFLNNNYDIMLNIDCSGGNEYIDNITIMNNGDIGYDLVEFVMKQYDKDEPPEEEFISKVEYYLDGKAITIEIEKSIDEKGVFYNISINN